MTDANFLRWLADELGVAGQQHAAICARLREIAGTVDEYTEVLTEVFEMADSGNDMTGEDVTNRIARLIGRKGYWEK